MTRTDAYTLKAIDPDGRGLQVEFSRRDGRFAHRIAIVTLVETQWVLDSREGDSQDGSPPSPALQQADFTSPSKGVAVGLLLGMAGRNHWSMSVEAQPDHRRLRFDVACKRPQDNSVSLSSSYATRQSFQLEKELAPIAARCEVRGSWCRLQGVELDDVPAATLRVEARTLVVIPPLDHGLVTIRWCYDVTLVVDG